MRRQLGLPPTLDSHGVTKKYVDDEIVEATQGLGMVVGSGVSVDNSLVRWVGISGTTVQSSGVIVSDDDDLSVPGDITGANLSGTNTGDQDLSGLVTKTTTVNGHALSSNVTVTKSDVGLGSVDNTADAAKPISTAAQAALDLKAPLASPTFTGTVSGITKAMVGLGNVDNTSDVNKPISTAQQSALDGKADASHTHTIADTTGLQAALDAASGDIGDIQDALDLKADLVGGVIPTSQVPALALTSTQAVSSEAAMLALTGVQQGDLAVRTDGAGTFILGAADPSVLSNWILLDPPVDTVTSVNGQQGTVVLGKADVGLSNVNNTSDANKPISTATQAALDLKAPLASPTFTGTVSGITKSMVGLGSVDNTSDTAKPISTATQAALDLKAPLASPTFTGTVGGITKAMVGLSAVDNTADVDKPVSTAQDAAISAKYTKPGTGIPASDLATAVQTSLGLADTALQSIANNSVTNAAMADDAVGIAELSATGTPDATTFLRGDNSWAVVDTSGKEPTITAGTTGQYWRGDKTWQTLDKTAVGLANVDNTSDTNKPVSTATQAALDDKVPTTRTVNGHALSANVTVTKSDVGLGSVDNTSDLDKPVSTATQTALDSKVDENAPITGATKTKVTYDAKGLVTAGADATTADIADSTNKRYVSDAQLTVIGNTSGTNTGDQSSIVGITGTKAQFNTAVTDGDIVYTDNAALTDTRTPTDGTVTTAKFAAAALVTAAEGVASSDNDTSIPTTAAVKAYADSVGGVSGLTASAAELNILDGATLSTAELNYVDGVTSAIQTQLDTKAPLASPTFTGTVSGITKSMVGLGNVDNTSDSTKNSAAVTLTNKEIDGLLNTLKNISGMTIAAQVVALGGETFTISGGSITQIDGTTVNGYSPQIGDRILVCGAPGSSGPGTAYSMTVQPANGVYVVTGNTTNLTVQRAHDWSGTHNPAGRFVWTQEGSWAPGTLWFCASPSNSTSAFTWGTTNLLFKAVFGGNGDTTIYTFNTSNLYVQGSSYTARLAQNGAAVAPQTLTLPDPTTDTLVSRTSTDTLTNKRITKRVNDINAPGATPTLAWDSYDMIVLRGLNAAITSMSSGISGSPTQGQPWLLRIKDDGTARAIDWGASYRAIAVTLPTTTIAGKTMYVGGFYDATSGVYDVTAVGVEA